MNWDLINNASSIIGIVCAIFSGVSWYKSKKYYNKVADNSNLEKLSSSDSIVENVRKSYQNIKRAYPNIRGKNFTYIDKEYSEIDNNLTKIRSKIPSQYKEIINSIDSAKSFLNLIKLQNNSYDAYSFCELETHITNIEDGIKLNKEKIKGF